MCACHQHFLLAFAKRTAVSEKVCNRARHEQHVLATFQLLPCKNLKPEGNDLHWNTQPSDTKTLCSAS